ncbi:MAG: hypothetical protein P1U32_03650 [Legionellaceae bacterium]|nr:hypothetical protein [Legionellaceae bacterium]
MTRVLGNTADSPLLGTTALKEQLLNTTAPSGTAPFLQVPKNTPLTDTPNSKPLQKTALNLKKKDAPPAPKKKATTYKAKVTESVTKLDKDGSIYSAYGFLDVLNLGPKMLELGCGLQYGLQDDASAAEDMYNWLRTPEGLIAATLGIVPIALIGAFANSYYNSETAAGKAVYRAWQSFRDAAKGIKNALRGTKSTVKAIYLLAAKDYSFLLLWAGGFFAIASALNRTWNRGMINARKDMMDDNKAAISDLDHWGTFRELTTPLPEDGSEALKKHANGFRLIRDRNDKSKNELYYISYDYETKQAKSHRVHIDAKKLNTLLNHTDASRDLNPLHPSILQWRSLLPGIAEKHYAAFHKAITERVNKNKQSKTLERKGYGSATYSGFIDGLYMFMGLISITAMTPQILFVVSCVSLFFCATCIVTRLHEEKDFQRNLYISRHKTELALSAKNLEIQLSKRAEIEHRILKVTNDLSIELDDDALTKLLQKADASVNAALAQFNGDRKKLFETQKISKTDAILMGLRQALAAYTALVCSVFAISAVSSLFFATALPELVALCTVLAGVALVVGFTAYSLSIARDYTAKQKQHQADKDVSIYNFVEKYKNKPLNVLLKEFPKEKGKQGSSTLFDLGLDLALPIYFLMSWTDIFRAAFSGLLKAIKFFLMGCELTGFSADMSNPLTYLFIVPAIVSFAFVWAGRVAGKHLKSLFDQSNDVANTADKKSASEKGTSQEEKAKNSVNKNASKAHQDAKQEKNSPHDGEDPLHDDASVDSADTSENAPANTSILAKSSMFNSSVPMPTQSSRRRYSITEATSTSNAKAGEGGASSGNQRERSPSWEPPRSLMFS